MKKDYYLILRLTPEAVAEEIRSAYRRLAIELHPDLSGIGSDQFLELQEAYSVLSDPKRRAVYDREAEEIPIRRTDLARPKETVIGRRHSAEPLTPVQPVGFEEIRHDCHTQELRSWKGSRRMAFDEVRSAL